MSKITGDLYIEGEQFPFVDSSINAHPITNYDVTLDTTTKKFNNGSMYFSGVETSLEVPAHERLNIYSGEEWTMDMWYWPVEDGVGYNRLIEAGTSGNRYILNHDSAGNLEFRRGTGATTSVQIFEVPEEELTFEVWNHIAITKTTEDIWTMYINGVAKVTDDWSGDREITGAFKIGRRGTLPNSWATYKLIGNLDNLRVVRGQCLWTENFDLDKNSLFQSNPPVPTSTIYRAKNPRLRGKAKQGFVRPTICQFFTSMDFEEINLPELVGYTEDRCIISSNAIASSTGASSDGPMKLFDDVGGSYSSTAWENDFTLGYPCWCGYSFGVSTQILRYTITAIELNQNLYSPKDWEFQGSNGGEWVTLHTVTNEVNWAYREKKTFTFDNEDSYLQYRILITSNCLGDNYIFIDEMEMMEGIYG